MKKLLVVCNVYDTDGESHFSYRVMTQDQFDHLMSLSKQVTQSNDFTSEMLMFDYLRTFNVVDVNQLQNIEEVTHINIKENTGTSTVAQLTHVTSIIIHN